MAVTHSHGLEDIPRNILDILAYLFQEGVNNEPLWAVEINKAPDMLTNLVHGYDSNGYSTRDFHASPLLRHTDEDIAGHTELVFVIKDDCPGDPVRGKRLYEKHFFKAPPEHMSVWCFKGAISSLILTVISFITYGVYLDTLHNIKLTPPGVLPVLTSSWVVWVVMGCFQASFAMAAGAAMFVTPHGIGWVFKKKNILMHMIDGLLIATFVQFIVHPHGLRLLFRWAFHV